MTKSTKLPATPAEFGALGGKKRADKLSPEEKREIAKKGAAARWSLPRATHEGDLTIAGVEPLKVANLEDGRRVLTSRAFLQALGRPWKGTYKASDRPNFIDAKNLDDFITDELTALLEPIDYLSTKNQTITGYRAELLPAVCDVYLRARAQGGVLSPSQERVAAYAEVLVRGLAQIGIISLIDDATGFTRIRARDELQEILAAYIAPEFLPWTKRFPDSFYEELHRVRGWKYEAGQNARNHYIGKLTNELIYSKLPEGVLDELRSKNPRDPSTNRRRYTHHQLLTEDIGNRHLEKQIVAVTTLLSVADSWDEFVRLFSKKFPPAPGDLFALPPP